MNPDTITPYGNNVLVRMLPPIGRAQSLLVLPETADESFASGSAFLFSGKGVAAKVLAVGSDVAEVCPGDVVLVDKLCGDPIDETKGDPQQREVRMVREPAIVAVLETA